LPADPVAFDTVFSMGVLYHRKDPSHHLKRIHSCLRPGGAMVLETLVLPQERYARMRNVWTVPGTDRLLDWIRNAGFKDIELADVTRTTIEEQRSTPWMQFESLAEALSGRSGKDPGGPSCAHTGLVDRHAMSNPVTSVV